jgi:hypothetical protein
MSQNNYNYVKKALPDSFGKYSLGFTGIGLVFVILAFLFEPIRATFDSLIVFAFLMGLGMCSLFLIGIEYLTGAVWSVPFRRIGEYLVPIVFIAPLFAIPVLFNLSEVYHWAHHTAVAGDKLLQAKAPYLNQPFFYIRLVAILAGLALFAKLIIGNSTKQDKDPDQKYTTRNIRLSAMFMPFFGLGITVFAIDWIMSLEAHWFSTIFGIYLFAGALLTAFATITLFAVKLKDFDILPKELSRDHFYNLGAFMFAFVNFWAYIAFSQFMLIWYANLPEETFWFISRSHGSWFYVSLGIIVINFVVPYAMLLSQPSKSNVKRLKFMAIWILFSHFYDLYWLVMPTFSKKGATISWTEIGFPLLAIGLVMLLFKYLYNKRNFIPIGDPKLKRAMDFHL